MKSIKEKSFELFPEMQTDSDDWDSIEEQRNRDDQRKAYRQGVEYVLEHLSMTIGVSDDSHLRDNLKKMIKLLKGK
jgi:hypothetical protein